MPDVRTTIQPGTITTVSEQEFTDLDRLGLIQEVVTHPVQAAANTPSVKVVTNASAAKVTPSTNVKK